MSQQVPGSSIGDALNSGRIPLNYPATNAFVLRLMTEERARFESLVNEVQARIDNLSVEAYEDIVSTVNAHTASADVHVTAEEKAQWNSIPSAAAFSAHIASTSVHITAEDRNRWNAKQNALTVDGAPTSGSNNPVSSGGVHSALALLSQTIGSQYASAIANAVSGLVTAEYLETQLDNLVTFAGLTAALSPYAKTSDVNSALAGKVSVSDGKGLSSNDYTTAEKNKLAGVETGAEKNAIVSITVNGTEVTPDEDRNVEIPVQSLGAQFGLIQGGLFFMPNGIVDGVQTFRTLSIEYNNEIQGLMLVPGSQVYVRNNAGTYVPKAS